MEREEERAEILRSFRLEVAGEWPETDFREKLLHVLDQMVWEEHTAASEAE